MKRKIRILNLIGSLCVAGCILFGIPVALPKIFGLGVYGIETGSMEPKYPVGSLIYVKQVDPAEIKEQDVITFLQGTDTDLVLTHRVTKVDRHEELFTTKGDANAVEDATKVPFSNVKGKVAVCVPKLGALAFFFQSQTGVCILAGLFLFAVVCYLAVYLFEIPEKKEGEEKKGKEKEPDGKVSIPLLVVGAGLILFAGIKMGQSFWSYHAGSDSYDTIRENYVQTVAENEKKQKKTEKKGKESWKTVDIDFEGLKKVNPEVAGWIMIDGLDISYPILHTTDDKKYLKTTFEGEENPCGAIFLETANATDLSDTYSIIYGHNMKDKSMFGKLKYLKTEDDTWKQNRFFTIYTPKRAIRYAVFAFCDVPVTSEIYTIGFEADPVFEAFLQARLEESYQDMGVKVTKEDQVVTLSTCSTEGNRFVVLGKKIDELCK